MRSLDELMTRYVGADDETKRKVLEAADKILSGRLPESEKTERLLSLKELAGQLGYRSAVSVWRLGVHRVSEDLGGGRPRYRLSRVLEYLRSPEARKHREALRVAKRQKAAKAPAAGGAS